MVFLSAGAPDWTVELPAVAGAMLEALARGAPMLGGVYVRPSGRDLFVSAETLAGADRLAAVWSAARAVAPWWPGWLGDSTVGLVVSVPGLKVTAPAEAMRLLGRGMVGRSGWLTACVVQPG